MGTIIAIANHKGGVGKTSLSWNLAVYLSLKHNKKVLAVDLDNQGNLSGTLVKKKDEKTSSYKILEYSGLAAKNLFDTNTDLDWLKPMKATHKIDLIYTEPNDVELTKFVYQNLEANDEYSNQLIAFKNHLFILAQDYDYVIVDCPPFIGQHILVAFECSNYIINPIQPTAFSSEGTNNLLQNLERINKEDAFLGVVLNNVDNSWISHKATVEIWQKQDGLKELAFNTVIYHRNPYDRAINSNTPLWKKPFWWVASKEMNNFVNEVIERIKNKES